MKFGQTQFGVVIPAYNEPRLKLLLERFDFSKTTHVVVVNDGSTDDSISKIENFPVKIISHESRCGVGAAIRTGLNYLKESKFEIAVVMAGNNKDNPDEIPNLLKAIEDGADYVQGSRYLGSKQLGAMPFLRRLATRIVPILWSIRFRRRFTEVTNGFRSYKLSLLNHPDIDIEQDWLNKYELEFYIHYKVLELGFKYAEVPVSKVYPSDGMSISKIKLFGNWDWWSLLRPLVLLSLGMKK